MRKEHLGIMWNRKYYYKYKLLYYKHDLLFTKMKMYKILKDKVKQLRFLHFLLLTLKLSSFAFHLISKMKLIEQYVQVEDVKSFKESFPRKDSCIYFHSLMYKILNTVLPLPLINSYFLSNKSSFKPNSLYKKVVLFRIT